MKLTAVVAVVSSAVVVCFAIAVVGTRKMADSGERLYRVNLMDLEQRAEITRRFERMHGLVVRVPADVDLLAQQQYEQEFEENAQALETLFAGASAEDTAELAGNTRNYAEASEAVFAFATDFAIDQATAALKGPVTAAHQKIEEEITDLSARQKQAATAEIDALYAARSTMISVIAEVSLLCLLVAGGFGLFMAAGLRGACAA